MSWRSWLDRIGGRPAQPSLPSPRPTSAPGARGLGFALLDDAHGDEACVGCGLCAQVCPTGVISLSPAPLRLSPSTGLLRGWVEALTLDPRGCVGCELCAQVCPTDALRLYADPAADGEALLDKDRLRRAAATTRAHPRRSPLGPMPVRTRPPPSPEPASLPQPRPQPAVDLVPAATSNPLTRPPDHPQLLDTDEPTRLEQLHLAEEAPTQLDSEIFAAVDPGDWLPGEPPRGAGDHPTAQPTAEGEDQTAPLPAEHLPGGVEDQEEGAAGVLDEPTRR